MMNKKQNKLGYMVGLMMAFGLTACSEPEPMETKVKSEEKAQAPSDKFDLLGWRISIPIDEDGDGKSDHINEQALANGYSHPDFFYLSDDGGMVFRSPIEGAKTSTNTTYTRSELREMSRRGDTQYSVKGVNGNNWVLSSAPKEDQEKAASVDGTLEATLAVNHVTTTGVNWQVGRVIIGQIHANDDEPVRLYYRKLPNYEKGSIFFAHEPREGFGEELWVDVIGGSLPNYWNQDAAASEEPEDGIKLNEKFSYRINVKGNLLSVTIMRPGKEDITKTVDMSKSGYDQGGQHLYFKAGVYNQNKTGEGDDYAQATFYDLSVKH